MDNAPKAGPRARRHPRQLFTVEEVAQETRRNPEVIRRWIREHRIPPRTVMVDTTVIPPRFLLNTEAVGIVAMQPRRIRRQPA